MRKIEKPELISTIRDKKKVWLNIRESRLMYMFHRKLISMEEYEAGSRYRLMCELMGGSTGDYLKDRVDGTSTDFITSSLGAAMAVKDCDDQIGKSFAECMELFCWFNYGIIEIAHILGLTDRKASNRTHEGLARLSINVLVLEAECLYSIFIIISLWLLIFKSLLVIPITYLSIC